VRLPSCEQQGEDRAVPLRCLLAAGAGDAMSDAMAQLATGFLLDALAPTNFLFTNPAALKRAFETGGASVAAGARNFLGKWAGKLSVRSGTARIAIVPPWDDDLPLREQLAPFAGAQVQITIPERV